MDNAIVTSILILFIIAIIEIVSLFCKPVKSSEKISFAAVVPIFPYDKNLRIHLEEIKRNLSDNSYTVEKIIIINYGATYEQLEICKDFCYQNPDAIMTDPASLEKILSKIFAFNHKT